MSLEFIPSRHGFGASLTLTGLVTLALAIGGCGRKQSHGADQSSAAIQAPSPAQPATGAVAAAPQGMWQPETMAQPDGQSDLKALNRCMVRWLIANKRRPKDFADFAATAGVPIPPPPAGKQYAIGKNMHIVLVDL